MKQVPARHYVRISQSHYRYLYWYDPSVKAQRGVFEHVHVWTSHYGPMPPGYIIHHSDGDRLNNDIDNLRCMSRADHNRLHFTLDDGRSAGPHRKEFNRQKARKHYAKIKATNPQQIRDNANEYYHRVLKHKPEYKARLLEYQRKRRAKKRLERQVSSQSTSPSSLALF